MFGLIAMAISYVIVKKLDASGDYKQPKGKHENRYK
jgi:hypothetical protein